MFLSGRITQLALRSRMRAFRSDERGNVAVFFTLALLPIVGFTGAAVDYSRANSARASMQAALDSTALILSKEAQTLTEPLMKTKALSYFQANFNRPEVQNVTVTPTFTQPQAGSFELKLASSGTISTTFSGIWQPTVTIGATSEARWGIRKLELALALDNTGSMASSQKMSNLKTAAKSLLDTLKKAAKKDGDVKVAIIPFDTTVKIGTGFKDEAWFDVSCSALGSPSGCSSSTWKSYWEGCVRDRTYPYDAQDDAPNPVKPETMFPIYDCGSLVSAMPLSYDWTALNNKIDSMVPNGNTNVTIGLAWGWHALTQNAPLTGAAVPSPDLDKVLIILTDGQNTEAWKNSNNTKVTTQSSIDDRTRLACTNIKNANIKIYAIRVIDGNATLLRSCATSPAMYYDVQNASQLNAVFGAIAQNLANLRLAK